MIGSLYNLFKTRIEEAESELLFQRRARQIRSEAIENLIGVLRNAVPMLLAEYVGKGDTETTAARKIREDGEAQVRARAWFKPEEPSRIQHENGVIEYVAQSEIIEPGEVGFVSLGVLVRDETTGWPGVPETQLGHFGVSEHFQPETIRLEAPFGFAGAFMGSDNTFPSVPGGAAVPNVFLAPGRPQPKWRPCPKGCPITVNIKNEGSVPAACRVRFIGTERKTA